MSRGEPTMPRTPEEFDDYVAKELRAGDKRMDEIDNLWNRTEQAGFFMPGENHDA